MGTQKRQPQVGIEYNGNITTLAGMFPQYSYFILGVSCLGSPLKAFLFLQCHIVVLDAASVNVPATVL